MMQIFINRCGNQLGPYTTEEIRNRLADGSINPEDFAWYEGLKDWIPVPEVLGIESSQKPTNQQVAIWNPNAAACLSVLFSPLFGSVLVWRNYVNLGMDKEAKKSKLWAIGCLVVVALVWITHIGGLPYIPLLTAWYFCIARKQVKYIKDAFDGSYIRKKLWQPLGIASVCLVCLNILLPGPTGDREATLRAWGMMDAACGEIENMQAEGGSENTFKRASVLYSQIPLIHVDRQLADFIRDNIREFDDAALTFGRRNNEYKAVGINIRQASEVFKPFSALAQNQQEADAINAFTGLMLGQNGNERIAKIDAKYKAEVDASKARFDALGKRHEELRLMLLKRYK